MISAVVRPVATVGVLPPAHHRLPMDQPEDGCTVLRLVCGLLVVLVALKVILLSAVRRRS